MEHRIKHLEIIQSVISRMAANSFAIKGWSITLVSALFALAAKDSDVKFAYISAFPAISFFILDGYFLWQERLYRKLYNIVRTSNGPVDFSMKTDGIGGCKETWICSTFSTTLIIFHGIVLLTIGGVIVYFCSGRAS